MSAATLLAIIAATGVTYDWRPLDDDQGGYEYVVNVEPELAKAALAGGGRTFASDVPDHVGQVRSVRVIIGERGGEPQLAHTDMVPLRHAVAKPVIEETARKHTVLQQSYPAMNSLEQGFQQQSQQFYNEAQQQRKSIGSELSRGMDKLTTETQNALRNGAEMIEGTAQNMRDGLRSVVQPGGNQAAPSGGYQPYSYNAGASQPPYSGQPTAQPNVYANGAYPQNTAQQNTAQQNPGQQNPGATPTYPQLSPPTTQAPPSNWTAGNQNTTTPAGGYAGNDYRNNGADQRYPNQSYSQQQQQPGASPRAHVDFVGAGGPYANDDSMVSLPRESDRGASNNYGQQPYQQQRPTQQSGWDNSVGGAGNTTADNQSNTDPWGPWPTTATPTSTQQPAPGQQQVGYGSGAGNPPGANPSGWVPPIDNQAQTPSLPPVGGQATDGASPPTAPQTDRTTWFPLVLVAAIGSIAWNFYLGMNYIDARNKYRAALRRSGKAYADAFDEV